MKRAVILLVFLGLAAAQYNGLFNQAGNVPPATAVISYVDIILKLIAPLMILMVIIAGAVYAIGQMFGAETRAKASVWSQGMLVAVGICGLIIASIYIILPNFFSGQVDESTDIVGKILDLRNNIATLLAGLAVLFVILAASAYAIGQMFGAETRARAGTWASGLIAAAIFSTAVYVILGEILPIFQAELASGLGAFGARSNLGAYAGVIINIVFFVSIFILITYMISRFFKVPEWEAYLNIEMSNLISSFVIVIFILALFGIGSVLALLNTSGTYASPPQAAIKFMQETVVDSILLATIDVYKINACTSMLSTFSRRIGEFVLTQTYKVFPGVDTFVSITNALSFTLLALYSTAKAQVMLLYFFDAILIPFVLPAGLILRFFPPTRDAGAFLIAVAFGFHVVFPMTYLINANIFTGIGAKAYNEPGVRPTLLIQSLCGPFKYGVAGFLFNPAANPIYRLVPGGAAIGNTLSRIVSEGLLNTLSMAEFIPILKAIGDLSLLAIFMPALSLMVTIAFINAMTKFIVMKV